MGISEAELRKMLAKSEATIDVQHSALSLQPIRMKQVPTRQQRELAIGPQEAITIVLHDHRAVGWNQNNYRAHWTRGSKVNKQVCNAVTIAVFEQIPEPKLFECRVSIHIRAWFTGPKKDSSNICDKMYEDALRGIFIHDDSPKYVGPVTTETMLDQVDQCRVEITITPLKE